MAPIILHSDLNCFYASVEINENPALAGKKIAVCGSTEDRHGIVLTASYPAKRSGVKTGIRLQRLPGQVVQQHVLVGEVARYGLGHHRHAAGHRRPRREV